MKDSCPQCFFGENEKNISLRHLEFLPFVQDKDLLMNLNFTILACSSGLAPFTPPPPSYPTPRLTALNKTEYSLTLSITPSVLFFYIILLYISPSLFSFSCSFSKSFCLNLYLYLAPPLSFLYQSLSVISFSGSSLISIFFLCLSQYLSISPYLSPAL